MFSPSHSEEHPEEKQPADALANSGSFHNLPYLPFGEEAKLSSPDPGEVRLSFQLSVGRILKSLIEFHEVCEDEIFCDARLRDFRKKEKRTDSQLELLKRELENAHDVLEGQLLIAAEVQKDYLLSVWNALEGFAHSLEKFRTTLGKASLFYTKRRWPKFDDSISEDIGEYLSDFRTKTEPEFMRAPEDILRSFFSFVRRVELAFSFGSYIHESRFPLPNPTTSRHFKARTQNFEESNLERRYRVSIRRAWRHVIQVESEYSHFLKGEERSQRLEWELERKISERDEVIEKLQSHQKDANELERRQQIVIERKNRAEATLLQQVEGFCSAGGAFLKQHLLPTVTTSHDLMRICNLIHHTSGFFSEEVPLKKLYGLVDSLLDLPTCSPEEKRPPRKAELSEPRRLSQQDYPHLKELSLRLMFPPVENRVLRDYCRLDGHKDIRFSLAIDDIETGEPIAFLLTFDSGVGEDTTSTIDILVIHERYDREAIIRSFLRSLIRSSRAKCIKILVDAEELTDQLVLKSFGFRAYAQDGKLTFQDVDLREKYRMRWRNPVYGVFY